MESLQNLKTRQGAVRNVGKITKAMEVVSATKMRKAQETALSARPYALEALRMLYIITRFVPGTSFFTEAREVGRTLYVVIASDRGLAGAFNAQIFRTCDVLLRQDQTSCAALAVGKKAERYLAHKNLSPVAVFSGFGDTARYEEVEPLAECIVEGFRARLWDRAVTVSTHFRTTLKQEVLVRYILPTSAEKIQATIEEIIPEHGRFADLAVRLPSGSRTAKNIAYILEPSPEQILDELVPYLVRMQLYHIILEANASEHSARRVAMKTASDNADELAGTLTLAYNKARQAIITKEIIEITGTQTALESLS